MIRGAKTTSIAVVAAVLMVVVLWVPACGEPADQPPGPAVPKPAPAAPAASGNPQQQQQEPEMTTEEMEKVLKKKTEERYYDPINKTDPFKPFVAKSEDQSGTTGPTRYELRFYTLRVVAWGGIDPVAMFEDPTGMAFPRREGDVLGSEMAKIVSIEPDRVTVRMDTRDWKGNLSTRSITIRLRSEEDQAGTAANQGG